MSPALISLVSHVPKFFTHRPSTPLRVLSVIAIDAALRSRGLKLTPPAQQAIVEAMELGAMLNDRFDSEPYHPANLRASIAWFAISPHRQLAWSYAKRLRHLERTRPTPHASLLVIQSYRENVNHLSLAFLWAIARKLSLADAATAITTAPDLQLLFAIVMQTQIIDDIIDLAHDIHQHLPSLAHNPRATPTTLRQLSRSYTIQHPLTFNTHLLLNLTHRLTALLAQTIITLGLPTRPNTRTHRTRRPRIHPRQP